MLASGNALIMRSWSFARAARPWCASVRSRQRRPQGQRRNCVWPTATQSTRSMYRHLLAIACLALDFLCIHPFRDGNGRVSRLLTLLALYQHGYEVGRYISLERLVEESREDYYEVLRRSSEGWHEGRHDLLPWLNYFLVILRRAYREFEARAGQARTPRGAKTGLIEAAIDAFVGEFTLTDLERACPGVSRDMVRRVLREYPESWQGRMPRPWSRGTLAEKG